MIIVGYDDVYEGMMIKSDSIFACLALLFVEFRI